MRQQQLNSAGLWRPMTAGMVACVAGTKISRAAAAMQRKVGGSAPAA